MKTVNGYILNDTVTSFVDFKYKCLFLIFEIFTAVSIKNNSFHHLKPKFKIKSGIDIIWDITNCEIRIKQENLPGLKMQKRRRKMRC